MEHKWGCRIRDKKRECRCADRGTGFEIYREK